MNLSDLLYGLRKWKSSKLQWVTLVLGFGFFIAITGTAIQIESIVNISTPGWIAEQGTFYKTVGRKNSQGDFVAISGKKLENLRKISAIESIAKIGFKSSKFQINEQANEVLEVAYVDSSFVEMTVLSDLIGEKFFKGNSVLVSEDIWKALKATSVSPYLISSRNGSQTYNVVGVIPSSMKRIGQHNPDLVLAQSHLINTLPFRIKPPLSAEKISQFKAITDSFPIYFALISSRLPISSQAIEKQLLKHSVSQSKVNFLERNKEMWVISGVEFSPKLKTAIEEQWMLISSLVIVFGFLCYFNFFNVSANRIATRLDEFRIRQVVGASRKDLFKQIITEQYPIILAVCLTGSGLYFLLSSFIKNQPTYQHYLGRTLQIDMHYFIIASMVTVSFILLCACAPLISLSAKSLFSRASAKMGSKVQSFGMYSLIFLQLLCTLLTILITVNMLVTSLKHRMSYQFPEPITEFEITFKGATNIDLESDLMVGGSDNDVQVSWADQSFVGNNKSLFSLKVKELINLPVRLMYVSSSYFESVKAKVSYFDDAKITDGLILNETATNILQKSLGDNTKQHKVTVVGLLDRISLPVIGKVKNLPHLGGEYSNEPVVYVHFVHDVTPSYRKLFGYIETEKLENFEGEINSLLSGLNIQGKYKVLPAVGEQLNEANHIQITLLNLAIIMSTMVIFLLCTSFYYQSHLMLRQQQIRFGIMRALGANAIEIAKFIIFRYSALFIGAVLSVFAILILNRELLELMILQKLSIQWSLLFSGCLTYAILVLSIVVPIRTYQKNSIMDLLRYRE